MTHRYKTGETISISCIVGNVVDFNLADVKFGFTNIELGEMVLKTPSVTGNELSVTLESADTKIAGAYLYEFWVIIGGIADCIGEGYIVLRESKMKGVI